MKKLTKILWGIVLVAAGVLIALNALDITNYNVFFDGWWTLFIIIPCTVGLFTESDKWGNVLGIALGVFLLLWRQDVLEIDLIWKLFLPVFIIVLGLKLIFGERPKKKKEKKPESTSAKSNDKSNFTIFSGSELKYNGEFFDGAEFVAVFGGIDADLRGTIIEKDCTVTATAIFGGVDIIAPEDVNIKVESFSVFGGTDNKVNRSHIEGAPTIYIKATNIFGGVDIK